MHWLSAKSGVRLPHLHNIVLLCLSENAEGKYISPFHDIPMYADESQVTSFYWNQNECAPVWTAVHHFEQLCRIPTSESEFQKYFWNNRAAPLTLTHCSRLVCRRTTSLHELLQWHILYCICFWRNRVECVAYIFTCSHTGGFVAAAPCGRKARSVLGWFWAGNQSGTVLYQAKPDMLSRCQDTILTIPSLILTKVFECIF